MGVIAGRRVAEGRLAGQSAYESQLRAAQGGGVRGADHRLLAAAARVELEAESKPTPAAVHARGVARLALGDLDNAVASLEDAAARAPTEPRYQIDAAAAYLTRAARAGAVDDYPRALAAAERALARDPRRVEPLFNRALALEGLKLNHAARRAWTLYLARDPSGGWADEARQRLSALQVAASDPTWQKARQMLDATARPPQKASVVRLATAFPQRVREHLEDAVLPAWGRSVLAGRWAEAESTLRRARLIADSLVEAQRDRFPDHIVAAVEAAMGRPQDNAVAALARAHVAFGELRGLYAQNRMAEVLDRAKGLKREFARLSSPFAFWCQHYAVVGLYYAGRLDAALNEVDALIRAAARPEYPVLSARLAWDRGTILYTQALFERALTSYESALAGFERANERENSAAIHQLIGESLRHLGEWSASWKHHLASLERLDAIGDPRRRHTVLVTAAFWCIEQALPEPAIHFFDAALANAEGWAPQGNKAEVLLNRARAHAQIQRTLEADADLARARELLGLMTDPGLRTRYEADALAAEAEVRQPRNPEAAARAAELAIERYGALDSEHRAAGLYLLRARALSRVGRVGEAEAVLASGLVFLEAKRGAVARSQLRVSYLETVWDLYALSVELASEARNDPDAALAFAERGRARVLLESLPDAPSAVVTSDALRNVLSEDTALVYYQLLESRLLVWVITHDGQAFEKTDVSRTTLRGAIVRLRSEVLHGPAAGPGSSVDLFDALIRPITRHISRKSALVIVPDPYLQDVPFTALQDRGTGRYLGETHVVSVAPSMSTFVAASRFLRERPLPSRASALVLTGPAGDATAGGGLSRLPAAEAEQAPSPRRILAPT